jgi:ureidoglycolate lyase
MGASRVIKLVPEFLTRERFRPFGDVIETSQRASAAMNDGRFERFDDLGRVDVGDGEATISISRCRTPATLPLRVERVERHPLGSQAFVPLGTCRMIVVVAPPGEAVMAEELRAFVTNGRQGLNYCRGTWHMPLVAFESGQKFLIVDRAGAKGNCEEHEFDEVVILEDA